MEAPALRAPFLGAPSWGHCSGGTHPEALIQGHQSGGTKRGALARNTSLEALAKSNMFKKH